MTHTEAVHQKFLNAREELNNWFNANPMRLVTHKTPKYCYITVMLPCKEDPKVFVKAYDIPMWGKDAWMAETKKAGQ